MSTEYLLISVALTLLIIRARSLMPWSYPVIAIGVAMHELIHLTVGMILNAAPTGLCLWPQKTENGWILGQVKFANLRWYNTIPAALAPILLLPIGYWLWKQGLQDQTGITPQGLAWNASGVYACLHALPSKTDLRLAKSAAIQIVAGLSCSRPLRH